MRATDRPVLVATVTAVFDAAGATAAATAEDIARELLAHDDVTTVRIGAPGQPSAFRVDVAEQAGEAAAAQATDVARAVAAELELQVEVVSVGLVRDADRVEVFRLGARGEDLVWGER